MAPETPVFGMRRRSETAKQALATRYESVMLSRVLFVRRLMLLHV